jgi:hypothetical protein
MTRHTFDRAISRPPSDSHLDMVVLANCDHGMLPLTAHIPIALIAGLARASVALLLAIIDDLISLLSKQ